MSGVVQDPASIVTIRAFGKPFFWRPSTPQAGSHQDYKAVSRSNVWQDHLGAVNKHIKKSRKTLVRRLTIIYLNAKKMAFSSMLRPSYDFYGIEVQILWKIPLTAQSICPSTFYVLEEQLCPVRSDGKSC